MTIYSQLSKEEAYELIHDVFDDRLNMSTSKGKPPHPFQVEASYHLAIRGQNVQLSQATGRGKSIIVASSLMMLGGIVIVVEPLLSVAADQVDSLRRLLPKNSIMHWDDYTQDGCDEKELIELFKSLKYREPDVLETNGIVIYISPQRLTSKHVSECVDHLLAHKFVSLVVFDECHKLVHDASYREGFKEMKSIFPSLDFAEVPYLAMSATFPDTLRKQFRKLFCICEEEVQIWGDMDRRDITMSLHIASDIANVTRSVKQHAMNHLNIADRKVIIYLETPTRVEQMEERMGKWIEEELTHDQETCISTLVGDMGKRHKTVTVQDFCNEGAYRLLLSTSAGDCGLNCRSCSCVIQYGFPTSFTDLVQKMGRAGRSNNGHQSSSNVPVDFVIATTLGGNLFDTIMILIEEESDRRVKAQKRKGFDCVLRLMFLPQRCIHQELEKYFEEPRGEDEYRLPPCQDKCWYCKGSSWIRPHSVSSIRDALILIFTSSNKIQLSDLPKKLFNDHKDSLYPKKYLKRRKQKNVEVSDSILRNSCHCLVISLVLCKLLSIKLENDSKGRKSVHVRLATTKVDGTEKCSLYHDTGEWTELGYRRRVNDGQS